jgi:hypothetical protein
MLPNRWQPTRHLLRKYILEGKITNPNPMIIIKSRTEGIKFECHKEESLISSQVL